MAFWLSRAVSPPFRFFPPGYRIWPHGSKHFFHCLNANAVLCVKLQQVSATPVCEQALRMESTTHNTAIEHSKIQGKMTRAIKMDSHHGDIKHDLWQKLGCILESPLWRNTSMWKCLLIYPAVTNCKLMGGLPQLWPWDSSVNKDHVRAAS